MAGAQFFGFPLGCVLLLCLASTHAFAQQQPANRLGLPMKSVATGGSVMVCGGGDLPTEIYDEFVRKAGGRRARIILIPSAYPHDGLEELTERFAVWKNYDVTSFEFLDTDDPEESDDADFVAPIERATGVWLAGGAQSRLVKRYGGRKVESALRRVVERGGIVAGTSAGAAVVSRVMILGGTSSEAVLEKGFGILDRTVVDTHFSQRARHTRLLRIVESDPSLTGIGVDENTAVLILHDGLRAFGESRVTVMISRGERQPVVLYQMQNGDEADISYVSSQFGTGSPTVELITRPKPRELLPRTKLQNHSNNDQKALKTSTTRQ